MLCLGHLSNQKAIPIYCLMFYCYCVHLEMAFHYKYKLVGYPISSCITEYCYSCNQELLAVSRFVLLKNMFYGGMLFASKYFGKACHKGEYFTKL